MKKLLLATLHQAYSMPHSWSWKAKGLAWMRNHLQFLETCLSFMEHWKQFQQAEREEICIEFYSTSLLSFVSWNTVCYFVAILYAGKYCVLATLHVMLKLFFLLGLASLTTFYNLNSLDVLEFPFTWFAHGLHPIDLFSLYILFSHFRPRDAARGNSFFQMSSYARANLRITNDKTKGKFPWGHHVIWNGKTKCPSWKGLLNTAMHAAHFEQCLHASHIFRKESSGLKIHFTSWE